MDVTRAADIIAAYGGDPARWPADERADALRLLGTHPALAAQQRAASALDGMLAGWATDGIVDGTQASAAAAAARALAAVPQRAAGVRLPGLRWVAGSGIAAALVAGVMLAVPDAPARHVPVQHLVSDEQAFATIFTPTPEEDGSI